MEIIKESLGHSPAFVIPPFDDFEALEEGKAREFSDAMCQPPQLDIDLVECSFIKSNCSFWMYDENAEEDDRSCLLSAVQRENRFLISQYEDFPTALSESGYRHTRRHCFVLEKNPEKPQYALFRVNHERGSQNKIVATIQHGLVTIGESNISARYMRVCTQRNAQSLTRFSSNSSVDSECSWSADSSTSMSSISCSSSFSCSTPEPRPKREELSFSYSSVVPHWNTSINQLIMKFMNNRIRQSSAKNFVFVPESRNANLLQKPTIDTLPCASRINQDQFLLQFGKVSKGRFSLDFTSPISPIVAFSTALSTFGWVGGK